MEFPANNHQTVLDHFQVEVNSVRQLHGEPLKQEINFKGKPLN